VNEALPLFWVTWNRSEGSRKRSRRTAIYFKSWRSLPPAKPTISITNIHDTDPTGREMRPRRGPAG